MPNKSWRLLVPIIYMAILYGLSSIPGDISPEEPIGALFQWVSPAWQNLLHIPLYGGLTLSWVWAVSNRPWSNATTLTIALLLSMLWGILDEVHQSGVPGRYGSYTDVGLNLLGALLATTWAARRPQRWRVRPT